MQKKPVWFKSLKQNHACPSGSSVQASGKGAQAPLSPHIAQVYSATPIQKKGMPKIDDRGFN